MAEQQTITYAPQWNNMTVDDVVFQTNNVVGNFNYPPNVPAYKPIMKFILNYPLNKAFTKCPSMVYQNFLREFWSTAVAFDPFPSTDEPEKRPLREFLIKFLVLNGQRPLTLDFKNFCSKTGLDYNNGKYVTHPTPEVVKKELGKISINPSYLDKTSVLKNSFLVAWRILFTFVIQVLGGNYSSTEQVNSIQELLAFNLITGTEVDIGEIIYSDLVTKLLNKSRLKYVSYPRFISCALQVLLGSEYTQDKKIRFLPPIPSNSNFTKDPSKVIDIELTTHMIVVNNWRDSVSPHPLAAKPKKGKSQTVASALPKSQGPEASGALSKKKQKPKSKRPPTETKESPPKPIEGFEQSQSVSLGTIPDPQDLERDIKLASTGLPSTLEEGTRQSKPLLEGTATHPKDLGGSKQPLNKDITSTNSNEGMAKTTPRPEGSLRDKDSEGNIPPADMEPIYTPVADPSGTGAKYQMDETQSTRLRYRSLTKNEGKTSSEVELDTEPLKLQTYVDILAFLLSDDELDKESDEEEALDAGDDMDEDPQDDAEVRTPSPGPTQPDLSHVQKSASDSSSPDLKKFDNILPLTERQLIKYLKKMSRVLFNRITKKQWEQHEEAAVSYADLKASIDQYYDENIAHKDQTDKLVEASMSSLDRSSATISDLYKGLDVITQLLKDINNVVKDDAVTNQKLNEATKTFARISSKLTEVHSLVKGFDFSALLSTMKDLQAHVLKHEESSAAWTKSSTNMAWNLGSRMTTVEIYQTALKSEVSSLRKDTSEIKSMMQMLRGRMLPPLPLKNLFLTLRGKLETQQWQFQYHKSILLKIDKGKRIATESNEDPLKRLVLVSTIIRPDPDEPVRVEFMINGKTAYLTKQEIQEYWDKEEKIKKVVEEAKLLAMSKPEVIKVVQEEAEKIRLDPRKIASAKVGEKFKKAQYAEHEVLKREHSKKVKRLTELNRRRAEKYIWTMTNRIKPEPITDVRIHPNTKPIVASVFRKNDKINFDGHQPFMFSDFGITELDELGPIIQNKKNFVVKDLMTSLSKRYERLKKIHKELGIQSALPAPVPEQASS
ncbi:hypothetical protein Tco_0606858 [Tanacetum coccineum]